MPSADGSMVKWTSCLASNAGSNPGRATDKRKGYPIGDGSRLEAGRAMTRMFDSPSHPRRSTANSNRPRTLIQYLPPPSSYLCVSFINWGGRRQRLLASDEWGRVTVLFASRCGVPSGDFPIATVLAAILADRTTC